METIKGQRRDPFGRGAWLVLPVVLGSSLAVAGQHAVAAVPSAGGAQIWAARDAGPHGAYDQIGGMAVSPDGSTVYVARSSDGAFAVVAHDALTGGIEWAVLTKDPGGAQIFATAVAISPDGASLFVTGEIEKTVEIRKTLTVAYNTVDGSVRWSARLSAGKNKAIPRRITVSPDGARVFVTGSRTGTNGPDDFWDYFTVGYSTDAGVTLWVASYDGRAHGGDTAEGIAVSPDGTRVFVTGTSKDSGLDDRDFVTIAYRATDGSQRWAKRYNGGVDDFATDLVVSPDGSHLYVAGFGRASIDAPHLYKLVGYDAATGTPTGVARYADGNDNMSSSVAISADGSRVFVTGGNFDDYVTVAFDPSTYQPLWWARYDGGHGIDVGYAIAVSPDGMRVYVAGESQRNQVACFGDINVTAYATVEYEAATGDPGWVSRYVGKKDDPDQPQEVAVSPDGSSVFVTGNSDSVCTSSDVATVAYQA